MSFNAKRKIKILRIIARLNIGGPAIHVILLTEGLDKMHFDTLLACGRISKTEGDMAYYAREKQVQPIFIPQLTREINLFNDLLALRKIYRIIRVNQPDIIHTHTAKAGTLGRIAGLVYNILRPKTARVKLIHTFHGHIFGGYFSPLKTRLFIFIEKILAIFTDKIIAVNDLVKNELIALKICPAKKVRVIPLGLELDKFLSIPPLIADGINERINIGIVGRLVPIKNHRLFLKAAVLLIRESPGLVLNFNVIGDGELRSGLEQYAKELGIEPQVNFLGWQKDLTAVYTQLDIVALTSLNEGTPLSLIEAMAAARPVVATGVGGVKELFGEREESDIGPDRDYSILQRGIIVKLNDACAFARALKLLAQNSELRLRLGLRAKEFVRKTFTKQKLVRDIEALYEEMA